MVGQVQMIAGIKQVGGCVFYAIEGLALVPRLKLRLGGRKEHHDDQNRLPDTHSEPKDEGEKRESWSLDGDAATHLLAYHNEAYSQQGETIGDDAGRREGVGGKEF